MPDPVPTPEEEDALLQDSDFDADTPHIKRAIEGEGSYDATREYNARTKRFLDQQGGNVEALAEDAADALDGPEREELEDAEEEGRSHARS